MVSVCLSAPCHIWTQFPHSRSVANRMKILEYELKDSSPGFVLGCLFFVMFLMKERVVTLFPFIFEVTCVVWLCLVFFMLYSRLWA